jgi:orotidine-5'-phosphate decarboxylase
MSIKASQIIVALDFDTEQAALSLIEQLADLNCRFKIGKEMFTRFGSAFVRQLVSQNLDVFLDLKFHDIPHTVSKACLSALELGVWMTNVHALGGKKMMQSASRALADSPTILLAVTVLTSMAQSDLIELGFNKSSEELIVHLAKLAKDSGVDGVVCSARESRLIKEHCGDSFLTVTPGIRPAESSKDDQKRTLSPNEAIRQGSDYLVIGRPITQAADPRKVLLEIIDSGE